MRYFLDTEFNGFGGELMSLALVDSDGESLYLVYPMPRRIEPWVDENVVPIMECVPAGCTLNQVNHAGGAQMIAEFFARRGGSVPYIITDWPDDVRYLCQAIITAPGEMAPIPRLQFDIVRVESYPTMLDGAVQHNALWDAFALRERLFPSGDAP
ncbi:hypothetical protein F1640_18570 [Novosphingobium sp. NBM11]|nr:hypothetical protein [Novosphingobium sp. NBM11]